MLGRIDRNNHEEKMCMDHRYGKKFRSYRKGFLTGRQDARRFKKLEKPTSNPYTIPSDILDLLRKRARWQAGYDAGWEKVHKRKLKKLEKTNGFRVKKVKRKK